MLIITKYLPATDTRGARIKASFADCNVSVSIPYPHELSGVNCHAYAVQSLLTKHSVYKLQFNVESINGGYAFMASGTYDPMTLGV